MWHFKWVRKSLLWCNFIRNFSNHCFSFSLFQIWIPFWITYVCTQFKWVNAAAIHDKYLLSFVIMTSHVHTHSMYCCLQCPLIIHFPFYSIQHQSSQPPHFPAPQFLSVWWVGQVGVQQSVCSYSCLHFGNSCVILVVCGHCREHCPLAC